MLNELPSHAAHRVLMLATPLRFLAGIQRNMVQASNVQQRNVPGQTTGPCLRAPSAVQAFSSRPARSARVRLSICFATYSIFTRQYCLLFWCGAGTLMNGCALHRSLQLFKACEPRLVHAVFLLHIVPVSSVSSVM